ncbi:outer membrane beta-barrel protein [Chryseobacterium sp. POE27]|uniref:outer membrane beta-barrel protein n=1 Tax=Chryseobacterium sp. POE27 TaxID=3138177 RepID=UPI003219083E
MSNEWLNDLRRKMEDHTEDVPDGLWKNISEELFVKDEDKAMPGFVPNDLKAQKAVIPFNHLSLWYRIGGAAAVIVMFLILGKLFDFNINRQDKELKKEYKITGRNFQDRTIVKPTQNVISSRQIVKIQQFDFDKRMALHLFKDYNKIPINSINPAIPNQDNIYENSSNQSLTKSEDVISTENNSDNEEVGTSILMTKEEREWKEKFEKDKKTKLALNKTKQNWMLGFATGNASSNATDQFPGYATLNGTTPSLPEIWGLETGEDPLMTILLANQDKKVDATIRHKTPVTFGASVYKNLGKRWSIGTGINYTKLSAELTSGSQSDFISSEQNIHYVGIPVQVNYNVVKKGAFTGYITGGGSVEKAVSGDIRTKYIVDGTIKEETKEEIHEKPVQVSVNTAVGVQFKVVKYIGIYAEPGLGYHFKDNSSLKTIYKEKPLNFNVKFGIRILLD